MTNEYIPYAYLIMFGLYETADIIYYNNYDGNVSKEEQRKSIFKDRYLWFISSPK